MRHYLPTHQVTANYVAGMIAIEHDHLQEALAILSKEPVNSSCYGLALANKALIQLRLEFYSQAEETGRAALMEFEANGCPHPPTWIQTARNLGESVALQGREMESLHIFSQTCSFGGELAKQLPDFCVDVDLETAHTLNSLGGSFLKAELPDSAVDAFLRAKDIYSAHPDNNVGLAETLTNLAQSYGVIGDGTKAAFALDEAEQRLGNDHEQLNRILIARARNGLLKPDESQSMLHRAAEDAQNKGNYDTAYLRYCISACLADECDDAEWGMVAILAAEKLEPILSPKSLHPAKLRFYKAVFFEKQGADDQALQALIEGARLWCDRLPGQFALDDYRHAARTLHDHFRWLAKKLLERGRNKEAFIAFETGRARAFALELTQHSEHPLVSSNPFNETAVDCSQLDSISENLAQSEAIVSFGILAMELVAFVIGHDTFELCKIQFQSTSEAMLFASSVATIASALEHGKGGGAVPAQASRLATDIARVLGNRRIVSLSPHGTLHNVPWRATLRSAGLRWDQLPFITQFSPLLNPSRPNPDEMAPAKCIAAGYGSVASDTTLDFKAEAMEFAQTFPNSEVIASTSPVLLKSALQRDAIAYFSFHGALHATEIGLRFSLKTGPGQSCSSDELLADGVKSRVVVLSACSSGVYDMALGDYPVGAAPDFLLAGAHFCVCTRFKIDAHFSRQFFPAFGRRLLNTRIGAAFALALDEFEQRGFDLWRHLACVELLGR
jgi:tetratricopeptide (TPR) repeat protein